MPDHYHEKPNKRRRKFLTGPIDGIQRRTNEFIEKSGLRPAADAYGRLQQKAGETYEWWRNNTPGGQHIVGPLNDLIQGSVDDGFRRLSDATNIDERALRAVPELITRSRGGGFKGSLARKAASAGPTKSPTLAELLDAADPNNTGYSITGGRGQRGTAGAASNAARTKLIQQIVDEYRRTDPKSGAIFSSNRRGKRELLKPGDGTPSVQYVRERLQVIIQENNARNDALRGGRSSAVDPGARYKDRANRLSERAKTSGTPNPSTYGGSREIGRVKQGQVSSYQETPEMRQQRLALEEIRRQQAGPHPHLQRGLDQPVGTDSIRGDEAVMRQRERMADELLKKRNRRGRLLGN